jgi:thiosulfate/3-mercaptopyruvate sulfurtransferase
MKLFGHADARILDCGRTTWRDEGRRWTTAVHTPRSGSYPLADEDVQIRAQCADLDVAIRDTASTILDVRSEPEFRGQRFWPSGGLEPGGRAGHVPTAAHLSIEGLHDANGSFRDQAALRRIFSPIALSQDGPVITYCTIGGRAMTAWFVLTYLLGQRNVRVYDGSWAEWVDCPLPPLPARRA